MREQKLNKNFTNLIRFGFKYITLKNPRSWVKVTLVLFTLKQMSAVILDSICCNIYLAHHCIKSSTHQKKEMQTKLSNSEICHEKECKLKNIASETFIQKFY